MTTFHTSREIPATPEKIFAAFSDPARLARWWGPKGFSNTFKTCEFKVDGTWTFIMHGPNGTDYPNECRFAEIDSPKKLVIEHVGEPRFHLTLELRPSQTGTQLFWSQAFENSAVAKNLESIVVPANEQNIDRLVAEVQRG